MDTNTPQNGGQAPQGGGTNSSGAGGAGGGSQVNNPNLAGGSGGGSIIDITDDAMVRLPGAKDPVRWGDHHRTFQSEFTKRAQEASNLRREVQKYKEQLQQAQRERQAASQAGQQTQKPNKLAELAQSVKSLTYLSGEDASRVVEHLTQQFGSYEQELSRRDMALALMYKQMKAMENSLNGIVQRHTHSDFDSRISQGLKAAGVPEDQVDWAKEIYLAYEPGEDLDREFPSILKKRWEALQGAFKAAERRRVEEARRQPFVPGKGGNGSPSRPLTNFAKSSAREIADAVWPGMVDGDVET